MSSRLTSLDASFLELESETAHMHVGWVTLFGSPEDGEKPTFAALRRHIHQRLERAPRYRQKLVFVPFGLHDPVWVDDPDFDVRHHVFHSTARNIDSIIEHVFSKRLRRDRPLWELWIADQLDDDQLCVVGKAHHCMVDGIAAVELASLFLDAIPQPPAEAASAWRPTPGPGRVRLVADALRDRAVQELDLVRLPARIARSPRRVVGLAGDVGEAARALGHSLSPGAPPSVFNEPISPLRRLGRVRRPLADLKLVKERYGVTINDVVLAVASGAVRRFLEQHGVTPIGLKAMVPVNVRGDDLPADLGNEVSFLFIELPCDEPDPVRRLQDIHAVMSERKEAGEPRGAKTVLATLGYAPHVLQHGSSTRSRAPAPSTSWCRTSRVPRRGSTCLAARWKRLIRSSPWRMTMPCRSGSPALAESDTSASTSIASRCPTRISWHATSKRRSTSWSRRLERSAARRAIRWPASTPELLAVSEDSSRVARAVHAVAHSATSFV